MSVMTDTKESCLKDVAPGSSRELRRALVSNALIDEAIGQAEDQGAALTGEGGLLPELVKAVLDRGLAVEMDNHLGYAKGDPAGLVSPSSRNGFTPRALASKVGPVWQGAGRLTIAVFNAPSPAPRAMQVGWAEIRGERESPACHHTHKPGGYRPLARRACR